MIMVEKGVSSVRRWICGALLVLAVTALGFYVLKTPEETPTADSSAALGMMLLEREAGLYVLAVTKDSPADRADIHPGDYLISAGDAPLREVRQLDKMIVDAGNALPLHLRRENEALWVNLPLR